MIRSAALVAAGMMAAGAAIVFRRLLKRQQLPGRRWCTRLPDTR